MEGKYIAGIAAIVVAVILVGSVLAPVIDTVSGGAWDETITTTYNEDPDLTFDRLTSDFALDITVTFGDDISIVNGEDTVTATFGPMFLLAADNSAVFINTADEIILVWTDTDGTQSVILQGDFTAAIADGKLTIDDGTSYDLPLPTSYLYVPSSTGQYGSFPDGELTKRAEDPVIAAGSFAGAVCYNTSVTIVGDAMQMEVVGNDTTITEVNWIAAVEELDPQMIDFDPGQITIQPLDPSIIDPIDIGGGNTIMTVGTPTYTDGDWGYDVIATGEYQGKAKIVSYSGAGGGPITVPAKVGGYDVVILGDNTNNVFEQTITATDLIISEGIKEIANSVCYKCSGFTGYLTIPSTVIYIGGNSFRECGFIGPINLPEGLLELKAAFRSSSGFTGNLIIPSTLSTISASCFYQCSGLGDVLYLPSSVTNTGGSFVANTGITKVITALNTGGSFNSTGFTSTNIQEVLNIGSLDFLTTYTSITSSPTVQDHIDAEAYIAPATITEVIHHSGGGGGGMGAMYAAIPVVILAAILLAAVSMFVIRRGM